MATPRNAAAPSSFSPSSASPAAVTSRISRIAIGLEYDGSRFLGWQTQPGGGAVQDVLEQALCAIAGEPVGVTPAGRTDRGVHAREQVVHFDSAASRPQTAWVRGVNAFLPESIAVLWAQPVDVEFHARYSAISRTYRYRLINRRVHAPDDLRHLRGIGVHEKRHRLHERRQRIADFYAALDREITRARRIEHQTDGVGAGFRSGARVGGARDAADLDARSHCGRPHFAS